jgi:hypothetical protein
VLARKWGEVPRPPALPAPASKDKTRRPSTLTARGLIVVIRRTTHTRYRHFSGPVAVVSGRSQISSSHAEFGGSGRCRITVGGFGKLQPNGRTSSRRRCAIDPLPTFEREKIASCVDFLHGLRTLRC